MKRTININSKVFTIEYVKGEIVGNPQKFSETSGNRFIKTVIHDKFFLLKNDGKEESIELRNWDISCREGHEILLLWVEGPSVASNHYIGIKNISTNQSKLNQQLIDSLAEKPKPLTPEGTDYMQTGCITLLFFTLTLGIGYIIWSLNYHSKMKSFSKNRSEIINSLNSFLNEF